MADRLSRSTVHIRQPLPVLALVAALLRLNAKRQEQLKFRLEEKEMNRRNIFTGLLAAMGVARAQQSGGGGLVSTNLPKLCSSPDGRCPAINNECPVCGTMADPLKFTDFPAMAQHIITAYGIDGRVHQKVWIVRCKRCNAAFWVDAEEPKR